MMLQHFCLRIFLISLKREKSQPILRKKNLRTKNICELVRDVSIFLSLCNRCQKSCDSIDQVLLSITRKYLMNGSDRDFRGGDILWYIDGISMVHRYDVPYIDGTPVHRYMISPPRRFLSLP